MSITIESLPDNLPQRALPEKLGFGQIFSDRMFTQEWTKAEGWHNARIGPYKPFVLDPATALTIDGVRPFPTVYIGPRILISKRPGWERQLERLNAVAEGLGWALTEDPAEPTPEGRS